MVHIAKMMPKGKKKVDNKKKVDKRTKVIPSQKIENNCTINDNPNIQEKIEYKEGDLWNNDKDGDDPNIQLQKLEQIMNEYNDNPEYIGLIKDDVLDGNCTTDEDCTGNNHHLEDRDYPLDNIANLLSFPSYGRTPCPVMIL